MKSIIAVALFIFWPALAYGGGIEITEFDTPQQAQQYAELLRELRCLVCQNQTLAESNAPLAKDMRAVIGKMVRAEADRQDIIDFVSARYGDFALYRPPWRGRTVMLWLLPLALVVVALLWLPSFLRRQPYAKLSDAEQQQAAQILRE